MTSYIYSNYNILIFTFLKVTDCSSALVTQPLAPMVTPGEHIDNVTLRKCFKNVLKGLRLDLLEKLPGLMQSAERNGESAA